MTLRQTFFYNVGIYVTGVQSSQFPEINKHTTKKKKIAKIWKKIS